MTFSSPPYLSQDLSVRRIMLQVLIALLPAIAVYTWLVGAIILVQLGIATLAALTAEALMLRLRDKPLAPFLGDGSVVVSAWLIVLAFPPLAPWWLTVVGVLLAVIVAKHLYGGLGQNPFNPAMVAFAACIVSFPALMAQWPPAHAGSAFTDQLALVLGHAPRLDAMSGATPLDTLKTALKLGEGSSVALTRENAGVFGLLGGQGWEWVAAAYLLGGLWLLQRKVIGWHAPMAFLAGIALIATPLWLWQPTQYADPLFHLVAGGGLLGAFFIVTDPVSGCTTPRGKLIFGLAAGILAYLIRVFGAYPDGVAFAVLLLNLCAPLIDVYTQPPVFGHKKP